MKIEMIKKLMAVAALVSLLGAAGCASREDRGGTTDETYPNYGGSETNGWSTGTTNTHQSITNSTSGQGGTIDTNGTDAGMGTSDVNQVPDKGSETSDTPTTE